MSIKWEKCLLFEAGVTASIASQISPQSGPEIKDRRFDSENFSRVEHLCLL